MEPQTDSTSQVSSDVNTLNTPALPTFNKANKNHFELLICLVNHIFSFSSLRRFDLFFRPTIYQSLRDVNNLLEIVTKQRPG